MRPCEAIAAQHNFAMDFDSDESTGRCARTVLRLVLAPYGSCTVHSVQHS